MILDSMTGPLEPEAPSFLVKLVWKEKAEDDAQPSRGSLPHRLDNLEAETAPDDPYPQSNGD